MLRVIYLKRVYRLLLVIVVAGAIVPIASFATQESGSSSDEASHICIYPEVQPNAQSSCMAEAVAYAAALTTLNDAQRAANEAYRRWYQCEYQGKDVQPTVDVPSADLSVLVRD